MKNYSVKQYQESDYDSWNTFVNQAKNATFLFHRDFMEYHKDRFEDFSLMVFDGEKTVAVLPANRAGEHVYSHQGLTYGGLVYKENLKLASVIQVFKAVLFYLNENKITKIQIKTLPSIYHNKPAEELNYALFLAEAQLIRRDTLAVIDLSKPFQFSKIRKRGIQKGVSNGLIVKEENDFKSFWNQVLIPNLQSRHNAEPVHTLEEIQLLKSHFDKNIRQFNVYYNEEIVAGTTVFESENVVHCQYISKYEEQENLGSLDFLYDHLINNVFAHKHFFDFGISNENQGKTLNDGLSYWKESFGANIIVHDFYEVATIHFSKLENVLK
ncbi:acetyltransferase (GNAT) family protein [Flavobacterium sp. 1]|uniref:GNAT family N-acetyltransferase n=1 Tax=Flavobacterium sp. 1 TaxID=2035200 RepID=UPI000C24D129|nr:GNAT family N-acetyltransferase [Flavobacterium sp. 1]PJJ09051.1 acetyltransferase (GNAT) family protein [Flavobacterium sp. 1]